MMTDDERAMHRVLALHHKRLASEAIQQLHHVLMGARPSRRGPATREGLTMRVLVCGGRDFTDMALLSRILNTFHAFAPFAVLIHGDASGADALAGQWARQHGVEVAAYPTDWQRDGHSAGPRRNQRMLTEGKPDLVIAFPTGGPGTRDMIYRAKASDVVTLTIEG
jgi:hypothetical protein